MTKVTKLHSARSVARSSGQNASVLALKNTVQEVPLMVRELNGNIVFWNRLAEEQYGWSRHQALGSISHHLLSTVFPCPLEEINRQLVEYGSWKGELIHTMNDGHRVKVHSCWELQASADGGPKVVEVNRVQQLVTPESAHFSRTVSRYLEQIWRFRWWFVVPFAICVIAIWLLHRVADHHPLLPLLE